MNAQTEAFDPIKSWFVAAEEIGEYIGIRFGRIAPGASEPEWIFLRHTDFDGIGGFAELLRRGGAVLPRLPQIRHPSNPSWLPLLRSLPKFLKPRRPLKWSPLKGRPMPSTSELQPPAVAWHLFDETTTTQIRRACRRGGFTINSFLLKHLTKAVRLSLQEESAVVPWMIPVNLRGKVRRDRDTANYSSYICVKVCSYETVQDLHRKVYAALARREHWANWYGYQTGRVLPMAMKKRMVETGRCMTQWHLGGFSNLGDWDSDKKISQPDCEGGWLFCPPVLRCQTVGAGCVTFQNRLSLTIQAHPELTSDPATPREWVQNWVKEIEIDLASLLPETVPFGSWLNS